MVSFLLWALIFILTSLMWEKIPGPLPQFLVLQALSQGGSMLLSLLLVQVNCWVHYFSKLILLASWWKLRFLCPLSIFGFPHPSWRCIRNLSHTSTRLAYTIKMEFHRMWESGPWDYLFCATNRKLHGWGLGTYPRDHDHHARARSWCTTINESAHLLE